MTRFAFFYQSVISDWNHGNAHFLRGIARELQRRGHDVDVYEPRSGWSRTNLVAEHGERAIGEFRAAFPALRPRLYDLEHYDGVLAYGRVLRDVYVDRGWARRVWVWHEAADVELFRPRGIAARSRSCAARCTTSRRWTSTRPSTVPS